MARTPGKPSTNPLTGLAASWRVQVLNPAGTGDAAAWGTASVSDLANVIAGLLGQSGTMLAISGSPAAATVGTAYSFTPTISGGTAPYTVAVSGLPAGLSRSSSSTGATTGTPTTVGTASVVYTVTDNAGATATLSRTIVVSAAAPPINSASFLSFSSIGVGKAAANTHPNIAAQSFVADITFTTPSTFNAEMHLFGVWGDNFYGHNEWFISLLSTGKPQLAWTDGTNFTILSPTLGLPAGAVVRLRVAANVAAGTAEFFTIDSNGTSNSLGLASGGAARTVRYDAVNGKVQIGQSTDGTKQYTGNIYAASLSVGGALILNPVASNGAFTDTTGTVWTLTQADPFVVDLITVPNYPISLPPVNSSATPAFGTLASGATNLLSIDYTPGTGAEKVNTRSALDAISFYNHISGGLDKTVGNDGIDDPSYGASFARIGRYPETSPANVHTFTSQGLKLGVTGKNNNLGVNGDKKFSKDELRSGFIRLEQNFLPGMYIEFSFKGPINPLAWQPIWLYQGRQISPRRAGVNGPYDTVTNAFGTNLPLYNANDTAPNGAKSYHEIDILDMYNDAPGVGRNLTSGVVVREVDPRQVNPYTKTYLAGSGGFSNDGNHAIADVPWNTGMNVLGLNWLGDGSNIIQYILNGVVFMEEYWEFWARGTMVDPITGVSSRVGMCLLMGGQGVPATFGTTAGPTPSGAVTISNMDEMSITIGRVRAWNKNIVSGLTRPSTNGKAGVTVPAPGVVTA